MSAEINDYIGDLPFGHVKYPDVTVQLTGVDGNDYALMGAVSRALRLEVSPEAASEFLRVAQTAGSYDELIQFFLMTVVVL